MGIFLPRESDSSSALVQECPSTALKSGIPSNIYGFAMKVSPLSRTFEMASSEHLARKRWLYTVPPLVTAPEGK